jgi:class 3 adenylate cyclase
LARAAIAYAGSYWFSAVAAPDPHRAPLFAEAETALRATPESPERDALLAAVLTRHAAERAFRDRAESGRIVDEAIATARRSGDARTVAYALQVSLTQRLSPEENQRRRNEVLAAAETSGDLDLAQSTLSSLINSAMVNQNRTELDRHIAAFAAGAARSRVSTDLATSLQLQGSLAAIDGRYRDAERLILESADMARSLGIPVVLANVGVALAPVYRELGRLARFERSTRRAVDETPDLPSWKAGLAQVLNEVGQGEEAADIVQEIVARGPDRIPDDVLRRYTIAMFIEAAAANSSTESLTALESWFREDELGMGQGVMLGGVAYHGAYVRYLGLAAAGLGRHTEAAGYHEAAVAEHEAMRAPGWASRSRFDLALALVARNEAGDIERAASLLNQAVEAANSLGMTRLLEQAMAAKLELQGVPASTPATTSIDILSANVTIDRPELGNHADQDGQVTICFSDIVGYTAMTDRLGDHRTHEVLRTHTRLLRKELLVHDGAEVKSEGDGFMLAFRDPVDALGFAVAFQAALDQHDWPADVGALRVRMGIHRGEVIREADDFFGRTVIIGARVAASAEGGEVLVTDDVRKATGDRYSFGAVRELSLKGLSASYPAAPLKLLEP